MVKGPTIRKPARYNAKRRYIKGRPRRKSTKQMVPRGLRPKTYYFKRSRAFNIDLKDQTGTTGLTLTSDGGVVWLVEAALVELPNYTELTNLFSQYKITGLAIKFYPIVSQTQLANSENILIRTAYGRTGRALGGSSTQAEWLEKQATKTRVMPNQGYPISFYMKLNQLSKLFSDVTSATEDYSVVRPRFISTQEPRTPHYGYQFRFDNTSFLNINQIADGNGQYKVEMCYYIQCKGVE